jgi:hypothetical protein
MSDDEPTTSMKPNEQRTQVRREQKQGSRGRRADLMLDKQAKERARQAVLEDQQVQLSKRVTQLEARLDAFGSRLEKLEQQRSNP